MKFLAAQATDFFLAIFTGILIGIFFDFYRSFRKRYFPLPAVLPVLDFFWWMLITALVFFILLMVTWGEVRFYLFAGQGLGLVFYLKKFSRAVFPRMRKVLIFFEKVIRAVCKVVSFPFVLIKKAVVWPLAAASILLFNFLKIFRAFKRLTRCLIRKSGNWLWKKFKQIIPGGRRKN